MRLFHSNITFCSAKPVFLKEKKAGLYKPSLEELYDSPPEN